jgi:hypothetical protein
MGKVNTYFHALNVGVQDKKALARVDLERMRLAAEDQTNLMCMATGPAFMRPGFEYLATAPSKCRLKEFIFGASDAALLEFSASKLRVIVGDQVITRPAVSSTVINGDFISLTGWNTTGVGGGTATLNDGRLLLNANNIEGIAQCSRSVTTSSPGVEHALRIVVFRGPVLFRCGSTSGGDDYISETELPTGTHSLAFTPTGTYNVWFGSKARVNRLVSSIQVEGSGVMELPTPFGLSSLPLIRIAQSADVCFVACKGFQQRRIERRAPRSWSVGIYKADDGPFFANPDPVVRMKPSALEGNIEVIASAAYFTPDDVGGLIRLDHTGQRVTQSLGQDDTYTDSIRVSGIDIGQSSDRDFSWTLSGTWTGTVTIQRSYDNALTGYVDVASETANGTYIVNDGADNAIYYYRVGIDPGSFSGTVNVSIKYDGGGGFGIGRITIYTDSRHVNVEVLRPFKNLSYTRDWQIGEWSNRNGWPSAVTLSDGRLWWSGADRIWGSVSDAFSSFDAEIDGDSGPISRSIATGGVNDTQWMLSLQRLLVGTEGSVSTVKSSSLDEPLTPTNFGIRDSSTTGAAAVDPIKVDARGIFVERSGTALLELTFSGEASDYAATQISKLTTELFGSSVVSIAVQRRPDTRIWMAMADGSAVCMVYEPDQEVLAFIPIKTDGFFESMAVLPELVQDRVYASIRRVINGSTVRYVEKMATDAEVKPSTFCMTSDSFRRFQNSPASATVAGLGHLVGKTVVVWADGDVVEASLGVPATFVVSGGGTITLPSAKSAGVVGLAYPSGARYKSARLAYGAAGGTAMLQKKAVDSIGFVMTDFHRRGVKVGPSFDDPYRGLYPMPEIIDGKQAPAIVLSDVHDEEPFPFGGEWDTDSRVCMQIVSPYTATICGMFISVTTNER